MIDMSSANTQNLTKVDDVILTRDAIDLLETFQGDKNQEIKRWRDDFADAISAIIELASDREERVHQLDDYRKLLSNLAANRRDILYLQKP